MNNIPQLYAEHFRRTGVSPSFFLPLSAMPVAEAKFTDQLLIDEQVENAIDNGVSIYKPQLKIVTDYIKSHNNYEDAADNIHKIYSELDNEKNAEYLTQILFASDLTGHLSFNSEIQVEQSKDKALSVYRFYAKLTDNYQKLLTLCFDKPPEEAIDFLKSKKVEINWNWREQLDSINRHAFTVAKVSNADILQMFKDELLKSLDDGKPFEDFKKEMSSLLTDKGYAKREDGTAWQLDNIYRTNLQSSFMAGRYNGQIAVADDFPYWEYVAVMDSRTRDTHAQMNGVIRKFDDDMWKNWYPSNGYRCRCRVVVYNDRTLKRDGRQITKNVPNIKPDDGFASNPSVAWKPDLKRYDVDIRNELNNDLRKSSGITPTESIKELERIAQEKYGIKANYSFIKDKRVIGDIHDALDDMQKQGYKKMFKYIKEETDKSVKDWSIASTDQETLFLGKKFYGSKTPDYNLLKGSIYHEYAHLLTEDLYNNTREFRLKANTIFAEYQKAISSEKEKIKNAKAKLDERADKREVSYEDYVKEDKILKSTVNENLISEYSLQDEYEFMSESFKHSKHLKTDNKFANDMTKLLDKYSLP